MRLLFGVLVWVTVSLSASIVRADAGVGDDALPSLRRLRLASERDPSLALRLGLDYGFTEEVRDAPGTHHRLAMRGAVGLTPLRWLGFGLRLDGRYDTHSANDRGYVQTGGVEARATPCIGSGPLCLGGRVGVTFHGGSGLGAAVFRATAVELSMLAALELGATTLGLEVGYRIDHSARALGDRVLSLPDKLAIGVSDFDAGLVRFGVAHRFEKLALFGELSLDALGLFSGRDDAPSIGRSPSHALLGMRVFTGPVQLDASVDVSLGARPRVSDASPYVPIDPRVAIGVAATYRFGFGRSGGEPDTHDDLDPDIEPDTLTHGATGTQTTGPTAGGRTVQGQIFDERGEPLVDARVRVTIGGATLDVYTDGEGRFVITNLPSGSGSAQVTASGHASHELEFGAGEILWPSDLSLPRATTSIVRGRARGMDGDRPVVSVRIEPGGRSVPVDEEGEFTVELPPGRYTIHVSAQGYTSQRRQVRVTAGEVTVLNVDLHGSGR